VKVVYFCNCFFRVLGVTRLRVVDGGIFPVTTNVEINAPIMMIAEKISDEIINHDFLPQLKQNS
jgi:choline dehydrogenase